MAEHFQTLLHSIISNPDQRCSELEYLTQAEKRQQLHTWNDTRMDYAEDTCLPRLFEAQVERTPDAVAVMFDQKALTYRELDVCANQLARLLQKRGVEAQTLVGLCLERSIEMVVGVLGILKARRRLCASGPRPPGTASSVRAGAHPDSGFIDSESPACQPSCQPAGRRCAGGMPGYRARPNRAGGGKQIRCRHPGHRPSLRDLYFRLNRQTQRGLYQTAVCRQSTRLHAARTRCLHRGSPGGDYYARLRYLCFGTASANHFGGLPGDCPKDGRLRRRTANPTTTYQCGDDPAGDAGDLANAFLVWLPADGVKSALWGGRRCRRIWRNGCTIKGAGSGTSMVLQKQRSGRPSRG